MSLSEGVVKDLITWIEDNIHRQLFIDEVAQQSGYSKWHLQRIFFNYTGVNIATYIRTRKLILAAHDLCTTGSPVVEISDKYGFDSQQSFTRSFSKAFRISPAAYRKDAVRSRLK